MDTPQQNTLCATDLDLRQQVDDLKRVVEDLAHRVMILEQSVDVPLEIDVLQHVYAEGHEFKPGLGPPVGRRKGSLR